MSTAEPVRQSTVGRRVRTVIGALLILALALWGLGRYLFDAAKDPGLGLRELHGQGITGAGVGVAVIDGRLRTDHIEFKDRIKHYEEITPLTGVPLEVEMHPPAVVSILAGKDIGTAPGADVYYFAVDLARMTAADVGGAVRRIIDFNRTLPKDRKIRLISLSTGFAREAGPLDEAVDAAWREGILVVNSVVPTRTVPPLAVRGLGCPPWLDRNNPANYRLSPQMVKAAKANAGGVAAFLRLRTASDRQKGYATLYVPTDWRVLAGPRRVKQYVLYAEGGDSWWPPYIAGVLALALQRNPRLNPAQLVGLLAKGVYELKDGVRLIAPERIVELAGTL